MKLKNLFKIFSKAKTIDIASWETTESPMPMLDPESNLPFVQVIQVGDWMYAVDTRYINIDDMADKRAGGIIRTKCNAPKNAVVPVKMYNEEK